MKINLLNFILKILNIVKTILKKLILNYQFLFINLLKKNLEKLELLINLSKFINNKSNLLFYKK